MALKAFETTGIFYKPKTSCFMLEKFSAGQTRAISCYRNFPQGKMESFYVPENFCGLNQRHLGVKKISAE